MRFTLLVLLVCCSSSFTVLLAQNYVDGYVVRLNGDTLKGRIDDQFWDTSPVGVDFKTDREAVTYSPSQILAFGITNGRAYRGYEVEYDTTGGRGTEITGNGKPTPKRISAFLRVEVDGEFSLLRLKTSARAYFYVQTGTELPKELIAHEYYVDAITRAGGKQYVGQLRALAAACQPNPVPSTLSYSTRGLSDVMKSIAKCKGVRAATYEEKKSLVTGGLVIHGGMDRLRQGFDFGVGFGVGGVVLVKFPHMLYKSAWGTELAWQKFPDQKIVHVGIPLSYTFSLLKCTSYWQSRIKTSKFHFLVGGTIFNGIGSGNEMKMRDEILSNKTGMLIGGVGGLGYRPMPNLHIDIRLERGSGVDFKNVGINPTSGYESISLVARLLLK